MNEGNGQHGQRDDSGSCETGMAYDRALNEEQRAAVLAPDGPVLVIAAAGTGKTRALTWRVAHLVERGVQPQRILLLTFTNRAAHEMLERARALVGASVGGIWGGTFHHLANRILRRHARRIGFPSGFSILDQDDSLRLFRAGIRECKPDDRHFPKPQVLAHILGLARSREADPASLVRDHFHGQPVDAGEVLAVFESYEAKKRALGALDFDDLLSYALVLLREHPEVREAYQEQFLHVLVDEYQDTNVVQAALVDVLAARHQNLFVVGDDFQSIYGWRGADFRQFLSFPTRYPGARVFKLETNYRSVPGVLDVANACIAGNRDQFQKTLRPVRDDPIRPVFARLRNGEQQAAYVAERVRALQAAGLRPEDMAVLYRSHFHALELQLLLAREGVSFSITSGVRFFEQAHIKDVLCLLRLVHNPGDELAFTRMLCLLPRVGERTAQRLWAAMEKRFTPLNPSSWKNLSERVPNAARDDVCVMAELFSTGREDGLDRIPGEIVHRFTEAFYRRYALETFQNADLRLEEIEELEKYVAGFSSLSDFLSEVALQSSVDEAETRDGEGGRITLSTVHQAKGLEWRAVFVIWLAEGMFPSRRSIADDAEAAEERRLFYVAATRARDYLFLCVPRVRIGSDGSYVPYQPSRFVREIPEDLLQAVDPQVPEPGRYASSARGGRYRGRRSSSRF